MIDYYDVWSTFLHSFEHEFYYLNTKTTITVGTKVFRLNRNDDKLNRQTTNKQLTVRQQNYKQRL